MMLSNARIGHGMCVSILLLLALLACPASSSKFLGYFITPSFSHFIIQDSLMRGLAEKGHNITVVSLFPPPKENIPNYRYIQLEMSSESKNMWDSVYSGFMESASQEKNSLPLMMYTILKTNAQINIETYRHPRIERLRQEETFDLLVMGWLMNDYQLGLSAQFNCPVVLISPLPAFEPTRAFVGNPSHPSFEPNPMLGFSIDGSMTFWQRATNVVVSYAGSVLFAVTNKFYMEPIYTQEFPPDKYPTFEEIKKNVALVLVTSHFSQGQPTANFPSLLEVSGMHIPRKPKQLPENIQSWLDNAEHGVIYFSMGSNVRSTQITDEKRVAILRVFARLPQRILWKWEDEQLADKPANVLVQKWLPQADILAHRNVRLFITHCGKGSLNEARSNGVPVLGIPVFADQPSNLVAIEAEGWAVPLLYSNLTEATFEAALHEALSNPKYGEVVRRAAQLFADRPMHPLDTAIWWVEYVVRHGGAKHMQSAAVHLSWVEYHSLDVVALFVVLMWVMWKLSVWFWKALWVSLCRRLARSDVESKDKQQ